MERDYTIGMEEEYQLVDRETGALRSRAPDVLHADWSSEMRKEFQATMVEIGTPICQSAAELEREVRRLRFQAATAAGAEGLGIVASGTHPFTRWEGQERTVDERYDRIEREYRRLARDEHIFGMHIHVAVPPPKRFPALARVRGYTPHLLALACSSPFFEAADTGFASFRMILWRRWPFTGAPPRFASEADFRAFVDRLLRARAIGDARNLYWSVRPHPTYPTLEFRATDVCPRAEDAVAIAALTRALTCAAAEGTVSDAAPTLPESQMDEILAANEWRATRHGLEATLIDPMSPGGATPVRSAVRRLVDRVMRTAEELGDAHELARVEALLERGCGADRMRRVFRECNGFVPLVRWLAAETLLGTGLDQRQAQREACA